MKVTLLDTPKEDVRLEIIPLIDVVFCILTFFILAAVGLTRQQAIDLDLPTAQTGQPLPGQVGMADRLYVSVDGVGQVYLDQQPVSPDLLYDVLRQFSQINPTGLIVLYAARDARYEDVITVLDTLRAVGGDRVALATLPTDIDLSNPGGSPSRSPGTFDDPFAPDLDPSIPLLPEDSGFPSDFPGAPSQPLAPSLPFDSTDPLSPSGSPTPDSPSLDAP